MALAMMDPDTFMPRIPPAQWWKMMELARLLEPGYNRIYVSLLFRGFAFEDYFGDGPPSAEKLHSWGLWDGAWWHAPLNAWDDYYDNGLFIPRGLEHNWVQEFFMALGGGPDFRNADWEDWEDVWTSFPVIASDQYKFYLGMASRCVGRMCQLRCALVLANVFGVDKRGRPANPE